MPESQKPALSACVAYGAVLVNDGLVHVCVLEGHAGLAFLSEVDTSVCSGKSVYFLEVRRAQAKSIP